MDDDLVEPVDPQALTVVYADYFRELSSGGALFDYSTAKRNAEQALLRYTSLGNPVALAFRAVFAHDRLSEPASRRPRSAHGMEEERYKDAVIAAAAGTPMSFSRYDKAAFRRLLEAQLRSDHRG